jgi:hypothetical protein
MKSLLLIGGFLGFGIGLFFSWLEESTWPSALWHACLGAYLTGMLLRWWGQAWQKSLENAMLERRAAAELLASRPKGSKS